MTTGCMVYADFLKDTTAEAAKQRLLPRDLIIRLENSLSGGFSFLVCSHRPSTTGRA